MVEDRDDDLVRLAAATHDLECDDAFTDALMSAIEPEGDALERISRITASIEPAVSFTDAIMGAVEPVSVRERAANPTREGVVRSGRAAVVLAGLVAAASVFFAVYTENQLDSDVMASVEVIE